MSNTDDTQIQSWNVKTVYTAPGTEVSENGVIYSNNWWTQGDDPLLSTTTTSYGPWSVVGTDNDPTAPTQPAQPTTPTAPQGNGKLFSPYVDMGLTADQNLLGLAQATNHYDFTLAFIQGSGPGTIGWAGNGTINNDSFSGNPSLQSQVQTLQAEGGTITISIGGASGTDPAMEPNTTVTQLQAEYQSVIDRYGVSHLDFDVEGAALTDQPSINLRNQALVGLEKANPNLHISFTLPVSPTGLDANGVNVLTSAANAGVRVNTVNIMAMDYGANVDNNGAMGDDAISAAKGTESQIQTAGLQAKVGITPMIGVNDVASEIFGLADAQKVESFAATHDWIAGIGMWSIARDNGTGAGSSTASATNSGISETPYQFSSIFSHVSDDGALGSSGSTVTGRSTSGSVQNLSGAHMA